MHARTTVKHLKARDLGTALRKRLGLAPGEDVEVTVRKRPAAKKRRTATKVDPWLAIKGTLTPEEGEEFRQLIAQSRRSRHTPSDVDVP